MTERHHRPHALEMTAGMVYYSEPVWRRVTDPAVYPDELVEPTVRMVIGGQSRAVRRLGEA